MEVVNATLNIWFDLIRYQTGVYSSYRVSIAYNLNLVLINYFCKYKIYDQKPCYADAECNDLDEFPNGIILGNRAYGDIVTYQCRPGYELEGNPQRRCQSDRRWSGSAPTCTGLLAEDFVLVALLDL